MSLQRQAAHLLRTPRPHYRVGRALHWSLSEVRRVQTTFYDAVSLRLILILSSKQFILSVFFALKFGFNFCRFHALTIHHPSYLS
jgi:hypothetical protein